ncbi:hypothetical protein EVAR_39953_1 [Eumeta japonica]|uniref:Uncharacterized protein n=1 Tax=Eumeta variegata TaxID=151549 RepID=A0A4C1X4R4_EUMVA|nr:hypothetical protein EVAR_39953_1 [Eumeta japonica]
MSTERLQVYKIDLQIHLKLCTGAAPYRTTLRGHDLETILNYIVQSGDEPGLSSPMRFIGILQNNERIGACRPPISGGRKCGPNEGGSQARAQIVKH